MFDLSLRQDRVINLDEVLTEIDSMANAWDIESPAWFAHRANTEQGPFTVTMEKRGVVKSLGEAYSDDDLAKLMFDNRLIRNGTEAKAAREKLRPSIKSKPALPPVIEVPQEEAIYEEYEPEAEYEDHFTVTQPTVQDIKPIIETTYVNKQKQKPIKSQLLDFKTIKLEWLATKAHEPSILVEFVSDLGEAECWYHKVYESQAIIYLLFDKRYKAMRFNPKLKGQIRMKFNNKTYSGVLLGEGKVEIGVIELTPFVILSDKKEEVEEEELIESY